MSDRNRVVGALSGQLEETRVVWLEGLWRSEEMGYGSWNVPVLCRYLQIDYGLGRHRTLSRRWNLIVSSAGHRGTPPDSETVGVGC